MILHHIPDVPSLQCLVKASPYFHMVYLSARTEVLTAVTLRELDSKGLNLAPMSEWIQADPAFPHSSWPKLCALRVCTGNSKPSESALKGAFLAYYLQAGDPYRKRIDLAIEHCNTLRIISLFAGEIFEGQRFRYCYRPVDEHMVLEEKASRPGASLKHALSNRHNCYRIGIQGKELGNL